MTTPTRRPRPGSGPGGAGSAPRPASPRPGWVVLLVGAQATIVAVFGRTGPSLAAAVIVVAVLTYLQAAPVATAVRSVLADLRRIWPGDRDRR